MTKFVLMIINGTYISFLIVDEKVVNVLQLWDGKVKQSITNGFRQSKFAKSKYK